MNHLRRRDPAQGQILVIVALAMVAMVGMVALVIDGGFAWGQQRDSQNASDASSEAGALVLLQKLAQGTGDDAAVESAVLDSAADNGVTLDAAYYTDIDGALLRMDGTVTTNTAEAARVGDGAIPPCAANCAGSFASGVRADTSKTFPTFFANVLGFGQLTARTHATAVSGYITDPCATVDGCALIPVTVPVSVVTCADNNDADISSSKNVKYVHYVIPLCRQSPGNVGWIDWEPPAGGTSELATEIANPTPRFIAIPEWYFVSETGNVNAQQVEDALNSYAGQVILIPMFDSTCNVDPPSSDVSSCPPENVGGTGLNQWYHFPQFGAFKLDAPKGAYITGNDSATCDAAGGSGATSCLTGEFVDFTTEGEVGIAPPGATETNAYYGIQLVD